MALPSREQQRALIDECGELERQKAAFKPTEDRLAAVKKEIASWYDSQPGEQSFVVDGGVYSVQVSARANERKVFDIAKLYAILGKSRFMQLCKIPLAAIDQHIAPDLHSAFLHSAPTGNRTVKAVAIAPAIRPAQKLKKVA